MQGFEEYAVWALCGVSGFLAKMVLDTKAAVKELELKVEREFQRKEGLKEMIKDAVTSAVAPLSAKVDMVVEELDSQRQDLNTLLDKFEVPAAHRHGH